MTKEYQNALQGSTL